jgi:hypothetical protein
MKRIGIVSVVAVVVAAACGLSVALAQQPSTPSAAVTPEGGSPRTGFAVTFGAPASSGRVMGRYDVTASTRPRSGCVSRTSASAPASGRGSRVRVMLNPSGISHWCPGTYRGEVQEVTGPSCPPRELCPDYIAIVTIDTLTFEVKDPPLRSSAAAPAFAGLRSASIVCSGGGPAYRLSWRSASDRATASARIVYDVFASHAPGGEDFSTPTWTTAPGITSFTTPRVPAGNYYFVVRARDRLGHEDRNRVQRRAAGGCSYPGAVAR